MFANVWLGLGFHSFPCFPREQAGNNPKKPLNSEPCFRRESARHGLLKLQVCHRHQKAQGAAADCEDCRINGAFGNWKAADFGDAWFPLRLPVLSAKIKTSTSETSWGVPGAKGATQFTQSRPINSVNRRGKDKRANTVFKKTGKTKESESDFFRCWPRLQWDILEALFTTPRAGQGGNRYPTVTQLRHSSPTQTP